MRASIVVFVSLLLFAAVPADAKPRDQRNAANQKPDHVAECAELRNATPGLYGLCVSFCKKRDQSKVDMNDIRSVRAAAPSLNLLERYNALKTASDPGMPCMAESGDFHSDDDSSSEDDGSFDDDSSSEDDSSDDDSSEASGGTVSGGDTGGGGTGDNGGGTDTPPVPVSCGCWTADQVADIDGNLAAPRGMTPEVRCTLNESAAGVYEAQVVEGYNLDSVSPTTVSSAFAYVNADGSGGPQGCMFDSPSTGILNFPLTDRAEGEACIQMIVDHCAAIGQ